MTTYYCTTIEEALRRVKRAVRVAYPGCYFGGITLRSGRRGFAIYREGKVIEQYTAIGAGVKKEKKSRSTQSFLGRTHYRLFLGS